MEISIINNNMLSGDIKPSGELEDYKTKVKADIKKYLEPALGTSNCPTCGSAKTSRTFTKYEIGFAVCADCLSMYAKDRPSQDALNRFFREGEARKFWNDKLWAHTKDVRLEKILLPLAKWVDVHLQEYCQTDKPKVAELYPANNGLQEAFAKLGHQDGFEYIEPIFPGGSGKEMKDVSGAEYDAICLMDALSRVEKPKDVLQWTVDHVKPGGLVFVTTFFSTGIDVMTLAENSDTVLPPDRINLFSYEGMLKWVDQFNLDAIEISTPGVLDVQNLQRSSAELPEFLKYMLRDRGDAKLLTNFQNFIQTNALSSHGRLVLQKKG